MKNRKKKFRVGLIFLSLLLVGGPLFSLSAMADESKGYQEYSLGEIVVSGKGSSVRDIAISDEVTPEDFEAVNADSVADALTYVPGVRVTYGRKMLPEINIHGFDKQRILTLIDGVPYYETKYGSLDLNQVGLEGVARIDVVKGAPSVLYGPNALGGVVNIITKNASSEKPVLSATAEYGVDGIDDAYRVGLSHGMKKGNINYWLSYSHKEWDSWDLSDDFDSREGTIMVRQADGSRTRTPAVIQDEGERVNSDYETDNFWAKIGVEPSEDTEIYVNFHYIKTEKGDPPDIDFVQVRYDYNYAHFDRISAYDDWGVDLSAEHAFTDAFSLQAKLYYHDHSDEYESYTDETYTQAWALSTYNDSILGGILLGDYQITDWDTLRFSLHYKEDFHEQRDLEEIPYAESEAATGSVGFENEMTLFDDKLSIIAGISYDWYEVTKAEDNPNDDNNIIKADTPDTMDEFNPMIGATYQIVDSIQLFASVAKKTRFPTLDQIYDGDTPNLGLEAETAINYTAGLFWTFEDKLKLQVAPFFHDISDYITDDAPDNPESQSKNYAEVQMRGWEVNMEITPYKDLLFKLGYMTNDASNKSHERASDEVVGVPEYTATISVQYTLPTIGTQLNLTMLYMGESYRELPSLEEPDTEVIKNETYQLCNAKITQPFMSDRLKVFLAVENLFDEDYEAEEGFPAPGMRTWIGVKFDL
ncbi:TonB-dependent receptor [Desulfosarcina ovata subsp. sediminis]|uniref:TonB-dependent receptor n=1 Tax=Desulfosarcina ovata subsp. sediminis TaxID=885957 RepID=A0A5K7ZU36_9BACT|nr:TonB-dependent receptor [Desulfosarcina ovata]BBO83710.1 TonB-dependent receptor [Desulfosarcina ovata subsp. sediminis]